MKTFILLIGLLTFNITPLSTISHTIHVYVQPPKNDGGSPIIGYIIEYTPVDKDDWRPIIHPDFPILLPPNNIIDLSLNPGIYRIRVLCKNKGGYGKPSKLQVADNQDGETGVYLICPPPPSISPEANNK